MNRRKVAWFLAILAVFLFVGSPFNQAAKAVAVVDDAVIAIIIAALAAMGITFVTTGAYDSLNDYVYSLLSEFASDRGTTTNSLVSGTQSGTTKLGQIVINNRFLMMIQTFAMWLQLKFNLVDNDSVKVVASAEQIDGIEVYSLPITIARVNNNGHIEFTTVSSTSPCYAIFYWENGSAIFYDCVIFSKEQAQIKYQATGFSEQTMYYWLNNTYSTYYIYDVSLLTDNFPVGRYMVHPYSVGHGLIYGNAEGELVQGDVDIFINTDQMVLPQDDNDYTDGDGAVIDVGADWGSTYDDVTAETIPTDFSDSKEGEATITYVGEEEAAQEVEDTPAQTVSPDAGEYQVVGLQNVFPFCIPFDIYSFFECLAADPVAPVVNWRFYIPDICDETITIDLSQFDTVAQIVRTMELLAFIVGLALVTREKFLRG